MTFAVEAAEQTGLGGSDLVSNVALIVVTAFAAWAFNWMMLTRWRRGDLTRDGVMEFVARGSEVTRLASEWEPFHRRQAIRTQAGIINQARDDLDRCKDATARMFTWEQVLTRGARRRVRSVISEVYSDIAEVTVEFHSVVEGTSAPTSDELFRRIHDAENAIFSLLSALYPPRRSIDGMGWRPSRIRQRRQVARDLKAHKRVTTAMAEASLPDTSL